MSTWQLTKLLTAKYSPYTIIIGDNLEVNKILLTAKYYLYTIFMGEYFAVNNKHLIIGHKGNSEFCFPETLNVPEAKPRGTLRSRGNKTHCLPRGQSLSVLLYLPTQKYKKVRKKIFAWGHCIHWLCSQNWAPAKTNLCYRKITITVFFLAARNIDSTKVALASSNA